MRVHQEFFVDFIHRKNAFGLLNPNPLEFLLSEANTYSIFLTVRRTVPKLFKPKKGFSNIKKDKSRSNCDKLILFFAPES
jgi:hypothetical protein